MKSCLLILLACAASTAMAQTTELIPEGSTDTAVGFQTIYGPRSEGSKEKWIGAVPNFSVRWSNGVFLQGLNLGVNLSDDPMLQYGFIAGIGRRAPRADQPGESSRWGLNPGAFVNYKLSHRVGLEARVGYGEGHDGRGALLRLATTYGTPLTAHQSLHLSAAVNFADRAYMQSNFGAPKLGYEAKAGIKSFGLGANWHVQLNNKLGLNAGVQMNTLLGNAADSPIVQERRGVYVVSGLNYHF